MVLLQPARRPPRPAAILMCLLVVAPSLALLATPPATSQAAPVGWDLKLKQGEAAIYQNDVRVWFLANNTTAVIKTKVYNHGTTAVSNVPLYFWFNNDTIPGGGGLNPGYSYIKGACKKVDHVPGAAVTSDGKVIPGESANISWVFSVPVEAPAMGYTVSMRVNAPPDAPLSEVPGCETSTMGEGGRGKHDPFGGPGNDANDGGPYDPYLNGADPAQTAYVYFVKEKKLDLSVDTTQGVNGIRWCKGQAPDDRTEPCDQSWTSPGAAPYNRTVHPQKPDGEGGFEENDNDQPTYFQVYVKNTGTWSDPTDHGGPCRCADNGFPYEVRVTAKGFGLNAATGDLTWKSTTRLANGNGTGWQTVGYFPLRGMAGNYTINVTIDPKGNLAEVSKHNNSAERWVEVAWVDFTSRINASEFKTNVSDPYPHATEFRIRGSVAFGNNGTAPFIHPEGEPRVTYRVYIPDSNFSSSKTLTLADVFPNRTVNSTIVNIDWTAKNIVGDPSYLRPGKHKIIAEIDKANLSLELNESNNVHEIDIYVADNSKPRILAGPAATPLVDETALTKVHPAQPFAVRARVTDDDVANLNVTVNFTHSVNLSHTKKYPMRLSPGSEDAFVATITDLKFHSNDTVENWTYRLEVHDVFGNEVNGSKKTLRMERWPIQTMPAADVVVHYADNHSIASDSTETVFYRIEVLEAWTGVFNQANRTDNLLLNVTPAQADEMNLSASGWDTLTSCSNGTGLIDGPIMVCNPNDPWFSHFDSVPFQRLWGEPGAWNVSIGIIDQAGDVRRINRTLRFLDDPPVLISAGVFNAQTNHTASANASEPIRITANFTDDRIIDENKPSVTAYVNFSRADGEHMNRTLVSRSIVSVTDPATNTDTKYAVFDEIIPTGIGNDLGFAGDLNVTISAVDSTGNWVVAPYARFIVNDTRPPTLLDAKVTPSVQEVGEDFTFSARGTDETNVTLTISILSGDVEVMAPFTVDPKKDGKNFTFEKTMNLSLEGNYRWEMRLTDSLGREATHSGTLSIRDNLGPRFEIRSPASVIDGVRYGPATPRIEIVAFDSDTVDADSIRLTVDDQPVAPELGPAPPGVTGVMLSYQVPSARRFLHGEEIAVNVSAVDASARSLPGYLNFTFKVDDVAPSARLESFEPRHREDDKHVWNVSLETRFVLAAQDEDGLPTGVTAIRYRILGGGANSAENLYTGPFRISDLPGVYRGPLIYQIQYWAEDSAGNVNRTPVIASVFVDDAPPEIVQFFPQGRYVNATFIDGRVGVARAVAWHRVNSEPYKALALEPDAGSVWRGVIPEARKGDRVSYYLQAWDHLGNTQTFGNASEPRVSFSATNHEPAVRITSPVTGSRVSGTFNLEWNASDVDGDALTFLVALKRPGKQSYEELARLENVEARLYPIDSRRYQDGEYRFRVSANDGGVVTHSEIAVQIINRADPIVGVPPITGPVVAGGTVLIKAEIAKAEAVVEARLYRGGEEVGRHALNDEGRDGDEVANDGVYSARVPVDSSGDYTVEIFTRYEEDGEIKTSSMKNAASFSAKLTPGYILREYAVVLVLIALAAAVAVGVAVWAIVARRR